MLRPLRFLYCSLPSLLLCACGSSQPPSFDGTSDTPASTGDSGVETEGAESEDEGEDESEGPLPCPPTGCLDISPEDPVGPCEGGQCGELDVLIVVDNSETMGEEQLRLAAYFPQLLETLINIEDFNGSGVHPDVHLMVTSTDLGHPLCTPPEDYEMLAGAPQTVPCSERLADFTAPGSNANFEQACLAGCPVPLVPEDPYLAFSGDDDGFTTNVAGGDIAGALGCIGPQGVSGCGYESPLEAMLHALDPAAAWNDGSLSEPFLREKSTLLIILASDEADCSVFDPHGYALFADENVWAVDPSDGQKAPSSSICWLAGVDCGPPNSEGVYADCESIDPGVLHKTSRYVDYLNDELIELQHHNVNLIGLLGVPTVSAHNPDPPYQPTAGGVLDLVYRDWRAEPYPQGDQLPGDPEDAADKQFLYGIGPGCTSAGPGGGGHALPPVRMREVCESLSTESGSPRCCIESICDENYAGLDSCVQGFAQPLPLIEPW